MDRLLRDLYAARLRGDLDAVCGSFSDDARLQVAGASRPSPLAVKASGAREYRALFNVMLKSFKISDLTILSIIIDGAKAAVHWRAKVYSRITGTTAPTELIDLVEVDDGGRITRYTEFFIPRYL